MQKRMKKINNKNQYYKGIKIEKVFLYDMFPQTHILKFNDGFNNRRRFRLCCNKEEIIEFINKYVF